MKLLNFFTQKCSRCNKGQLFVGNFGYNKKAIETHRKCSQCGFDFIREPGFYTGAMYISYALNLILGAALFGFVWLLGIDIGSTNFTIILSVIILALFPWIYRTSRSLWLRIFG